MTRRNWSRRLMAAMAALMVLWPFANSDLTASADPVSDDLVFGIYDLPNSSFEESEPDGSASQWTLLQPLTAGVTASVSDERSYNGSRSLQLTDGSTTETVAVGSVPIQVKPLETYTATGMLFIESGRSSFYMRFFDAGGNGVGDIVDHKQTGLGAWQQVKVSGQAPANAAYVRIFASISPLWMAKSYYDDFSITGRFAQEQAIPGVLAIEADPVLQSEETLTVSLGVRYAAQLQTVNAIVGYDSSRFEVVDVNFTAPFDTGASSLDTSAPGQLVVHASADTGNAVNGDGGVAEIRFKAVRQGRGELTLSESSTLGKSDAGQTGRIYTLPSDQTIRIEVIGDPADVNRDDRIDQTDLMMTAKRAGAALTDQTRHLDVNGDGVIDRADMETIAYKWMDEDEAAAGATWQAEEDVVPVAASATAIADLRFGEPESLGSPVQNVATLDAAYGYENGIAVMYTTVSGDPAVFNVVDLHNNALLKSFPLNGSVNAWSHAVDQSGNVYIAATSKLFRYSPSTGQLTDLGVAIASESLIYDIEIDEGGRVYGGTSPSGKVFRYDPATSQFTDYGSMVPGNQIARSIAYYNGKVYAGIGPNGAIIQLNPATGAKEELALPVLEGVAEYPFVYGLDARGDYLFAYLYGNGIDSLIIYDLINGQWLNDVYTGVKGLHMSAVYDGKTYFVWDGMLASFDLTTGTVQTTGISYSVGLRHTGWVSFPGDPPADGSTLVSIQYNGTVAKLNPQSGRSGQLPVVVQGEPIEIHSLEKGPDGALYMGAFMSSTGVRYDPATASSFSFPMGQAESMGVLGNRVYFGVYPGAYVHEWDTTKPLQTEASQPDQNPRLTFHIGNEQDRPYVMESYGTKLFVGTIPDYGKLGGALVVHDTLSLQTDVYRHVVNNQSIVGLAYRDGKIYGSSSIHGGQGSTPTETSAKMFVWDVEGGGKISEFEPDIPGALKAPIMISGLTFGPDGLLWAAADGIIFALDPDTLEVAKSKVIYPGVTEYGKWRPIHMRWGSDGLLYTDLHGQLTIVDTATMEHRSLPVITPLFELGEDGNIYYAEATELKKIQIARANAPVHPGSLSLEGDSELVTGRQASMALLTDQANSLYALKATIHYDPAVFHWDGVVAGSLFRDGELFYRETVPGRIELVLTLTGARSIRSDGEAAILHLTALNGDPSASVRLDGRSLLLADDAHITGGFFPVGQDRVWAAGVYEPEDANRDGLLNDADISDVAQHAGMAVDAATARYDLNGDGRIDVKDIALAAYRIRGTT
ncbi:cohesin domain-containing protein [Paenibacillus sp. PAMC21692]|uniref:cohesin domain-containing protein n=1 Tax=Paenibacillus sp. PAMC21692 TaxID=2762320 RepID=UPI00164D7381|nr:cohesin domain-containing protein [Paenibacillus sp. PAMC21692]QNK56340.1 hypothetical protein H7F31_27945 [Paenibacillus sp. PAMC21692]